MIRVLTMFQLNIVIPKRNIYGYISIEGGDMYIWGFFTYTTNEMNDLDISSGS